MFARSGTVFGRTLKSNDYKQNMLFDSNQIGTCKRFIFIHDLNIYLHSIKVILNIALLILVDLNILLLMQKKVVLNLERSVNRTKKGRQKRYYP